MATLNLKDRVKQLGNSLPLMTDREKAELDSLVGKKVTIRTYGFMKDEHDKEYVAFIVDEDTNNFYFGGQVLTDNLMELESDGYRSEIESNGLVVEFGKKKSKNGREYTTVKYL